MAWRIAAACVLLGVAAACARQGVPPGGDPDRLPPVVVETLPDTFAVIEPIEDPIRIRFSERISERPSEGTLDRSVVVSPRTGEIRVSHARDALEVDLSGGVLPGLVYRVTVLPVIRDMFGNVLPEPFEFVFSTGGELVQTAVAGLVIDRLSGTAVPGAEVALLPGPDALPPGVEPELTPGDDADATPPFAYVGRADPQGVFALRYVPRGDYLLRAFVDTDRDLVADPFEVQGAETVTVADTLLTDVVVVPPDTTAARLLPTGAELLDSTVVLLEFDDFLDPGQDVNGIRLTIRPDSTAEPGAPVPPLAVEIAHPGVWRERRDSLQRRTDSIARVQDSIARAARPAADTAVADTLAPPPDTLPAAADTTGPAAAPVAPAVQPTVNAAQRIEELAPPRGEGPVLLEGPLPYRGLVVRLSRPLPPGVPYRITVEGVRNVVGLEGGGGSAPIERVPLPGPGDPGGPAGPGP